MAEQRTRDRTEGSSGKWKRLLQIVAKFKKAENQVCLGEDKAVVKGNKTGQITNLRRERNVWMLDLWVKRPADAMDVSSFQWLGR